jgi:hypothetical protein
MTGTPLIVTFGIAPPVEETPPPDEIGGGVRDTGGEPGDVGTMGGGG